MPNVPLEISVVFFVPLDAFHILTPPEWLDVATYLPSGEKATFHASPFLLLLFVYFFLININIIFNVNKYYYLFCYVMFELIHNIKCIKNICINKNYIWIYK